MTTTQLAGVGALMLLVSFIAFAFYQGTKVRPSGRPDAGGDMATGRLDDGSTGGDAGAGGD